MSRLIREPRPRTCGHIAPFKLPHLVHVLAELPKNANGKTQHSEGARLVLKQIASELG